MTTSYRDGKVRAKRGTGSIRQRRPDVWEIRIVVGMEPATATSVQRSFTVHGDAVFAEARRRQLQADFGLQRSWLAVEAATMTVANLLERWFAAPHLWRPATYTSHRSVVHALVADPLGHSRAVLLTPGVARGAIERWRSMGVSVPTVSARWLVLRSALSWALTERLLPTNPLLGMRGPARPTPRRHLTMQEVCRLLRTAEALAAQAGELPARPSARGLHEAFVADQNLLLVRLAADSGARRGELAALRADDLDGRVLTIERAVSGGTVGPTKTSRTRRLTLGATTARMIGDDLTRWRDRVGAIGEGAEWLLAPDPARSRFITCDRLSHRFETLRNAAGLPGATLHRLRHMVATHLVDSGRVLKAQARLGHRDPATTLRHYSHAVQLEDADVADELDGLLSAGGAAT